MVRLSFDSDDPNKYFHAKYIDTKSAFFVWKNNFSPSFFFLADHFSQIEDDNGLLNFPKFEAYLRELLQVG